MEREFPRVPVEVNWSYLNRDGDGKYHTQGWQITPGLAVADMSGLEDADQHWAVVHLEAREVMTSPGLCEACAFAAGDVLAEMPGWDRPTELLKRDPDATVAVLRANDFGPCFAPPEVEQRMGMRFRYAGHVPGKAYRSGGDMPEGVGVLIPDAMPDPPPEVLAEITTQVRDVVEQAKRPWYEED